MSESQQIFIGSQGLKRFLICLSLVLLTAPVTNALGCTIVMTARNGLVLAVNNEDLNHPATQASLFEAQPSTEDVLQKYIDVLGGKDGLRKIRTRRLTGELIHDFPADNTPKIELYAEVAAAAPDRWRLLLKTTEGAQQMGYDGEHGWLQDSKRVTGDDRMARSKLAYLFNPVAAIQGPQ